MSPFQNTCTTQSGVNHGRQIIQIEAERNTVKQRYGTLVKIKEMKFENGYMAENNMLESQIHSD